MNRPSKKTWTQRLHWRVAIVRFFEYFLRFIRTAGLVLRKQTCGPVSILRLHTTRDEEKSSSGIGPWLSPGPPRVPYRPISYLTERFTSCIMQSLISPFIFNQRPTASPVTCFRAATRLSLYLTCIALRNLCFTAVDVVIVACALRTISTFVSFPRTDEKAVASRVPHGHYLPSRRERRHCWPCGGLWLLL